MISLLKMERCTACLQLNSALIFSFFHQAINYTPESPVKLWFKLLIYTGLFFAVLLLVIIYYQKRRMMNVLASVILVIKICAVCLSYEYDQSIKRTHCPDWGQIRRSVQLCPRFMFWCRHIENCCQTLILLCEGWHLIQVKLLHKSQ